MQIKDKETSRARAIFLAQTTPRTARALDTYATFILSVLQRGDMLAAKHSHNLTISKEAGTGSSDLMMALPSWHGQTKG